MKLLFTIVSLLTFSSTLFAASESVITHKKACGTVAGYNFETCSSSSLDDAGLRIEGIEINTASSKLTIQSTEAYPGVDAADLSAGLIEIGAQGMGGAIAGFIAGPVVQAMETAARHPTQENLAELAELKLRLAKKISSK